MSLVGELVLILSMIHINALSITSVYVIVDPASTTENPIIELKDHYNRDEQNIGYLNEYVIGVYIKGSGSDIWHKMQDQHDSYTIHTNATLNRPMSLALTFTEAPNNNYTWYSFLSNLQGTTIYHLYLSQDQISTTHSPSIAPTMYPSISSTIPTLLPTISPTIKSQSNPPQVTTVTVDNTEDNEKDENIPYVSSPKIFSDMMISLIIICTVCIVLCVCCISICCCFYVYRRTQATTTTNTNKNGKKIMMDGGIGETASLRPNITRRRTKPPPPPKLHKNIGRSELQENNALILSPTSKNAMTKMSSSIRINPLAQNNEGLEESNIKQSIIEMVETGDEIDIDNLDLPKSYNDDAHSNHNIIIDRDNTGNKDNRYLFPSEQYSKNDNQYRNDQQNDNSKLVLFKKFKKLAAISLQKLGKVHEQKTEIDDHNIIISPDSKSRTSISLYSSQPGLGIMPNGSRINKKRHSSSRSHSSIDDIDDIDASQYNHNRSMSNLLQVPNCNNKHISKQGHTYSLSMDQLSQLQHGLAVQTGDGIRIKLDKSKNTKIIRRNKIKKQQYRQLPIQPKKNIDNDSKNNDNHDRNNRALSLIQTYKTKRGSNDCYQKGPYTHVISNSSNRNSNDDDALSSNESMYNYENEENNDDIETDDGGYTTPTVGSNKDFEINQKEIDKNMIALPEEGLIANNNNNNKGNNDIVKEENK